MLSPNPQDISHLPSRHLRKEWGGANLEAGACMRCASVVAASLPGILPHIFPEFTILSAARRQRRISSFTTDFVKFLLQRQPSWNSNNPTILSIPSSLYFSSGLKAPFGKHHQISIVGAVDDFGIPGFVFLGFVPFSSMSRNCPVIGLDFVLYNS